MVPRVLDHVEVAPPSQHNVLVHAELVGGALVYLVLIFRQLIHRPQENERRLLQIILRICRGCPRVPGALSLTFSGLFHAIFGHSATQEVAIEADGFELTVSILQSHYLSLKVPRQIHENLLFAKRVAVNKELLSLFLALVTAQSAPLLLNQLLQLLKGGLLSRKILVGIRKGVVEVEIVYCYWLLLGRSGLGAQGGGFLLCLAVPTPIITFPVLFIGV